MKRETNSMKRLHIQLNAKQWLLLYGILMICLLFGRGIVGVSDYWNQIRANMNLAPFHTIKLYLRVLQGDRGVMLTRHAIINLVGNVAMFIPLGILLPRVYHTLRTAWRFFLVTVLLICLVELIQLFSLVGCCDIDDLILNVFGAGIGFMGYKCFGRK